MDFTTAETVEPLKPHNGNYVQYQVREVKRYVVTRYHETVGARTGGSSTKGEYENQQVAYEVAYALCKAEHEAAGTPPDDVGFVYPKNPSSQIEEKTSVDHPDVCWSVG